MSVKQKEIGINTFFDVKKEEIGRIELAPGVSLVVSLVNDEHLDLRLWVDRKPYKGLRFYLPKEVWGELKKLIDKVDKVCQERQERLDLSDMPEGGEHQPISFSGGERKVRCEI